MDPVYRFRLGDFRCMVVRDGTYTYHHPASVFFLDAPREQLDRKLRRAGIDPEKWTEFVSDYSCLFVEFGDRKVLIDTGGGSLGPDTGKLIPSLRAAGLEPEEIDTVVLTHGHVDHVGGNIGPDGRSAFPNARFKMVRAEWNFWTSQPDLSGLRIPADIQKVLAGIGPARLLPVRDQVDLIEPNEEILPGIRAVGTPGHTPGHLAISLSSEGEQLLYVSDAILHPFHIEEPDWNSSVDIEPRDAASSRRLLMRLATSQRMLVHGFHFPFPGLGHVESEGPGWRWKPLEP